MVLRRAAHTLARCIGASSLLLVLLAGASHSQTTPPEPLEVAVGIEIDQITGIDQKAENFGAVVNIRMVWEDPVLAFDADAYGRDYKVMSADEFIILAENARTTTPFFLFQNQQGQRWEQEAFVSVEEDGTCRFYERSTLTLQAPYFDFAQYPFDTQPFFIEIVSAHPLDQVIYKTLEGQYGLGEQLGEEAWILENPEMIISTQKGLSGDDLDEKRLRIKWVLREVEVRCLQCQS